MTASDNSENTVPPVTIHRHRIGPGNPTFIVAEAGVNHNGCVESALRLVDTAVDAGADAVKFQMFRSADLVTADASTAAYQQHGCGESSQRAMLLRLELSQEAFERIRDYCDLRSILFLATPFGPHDVGRLVKLGVSAIKIASTDLTNEPLLGTVVETGLPIILSTGVSTEAEMRGGVDRLRHLGAGERLVLLHCISCYPTPVEALNLRSIAALRRMFRVPCGLSDHSTSTQTGGWAVAAGASVLEKHFTLDRTAAGPDHAMSLTPEQIAEYIAAVRRVETALGDGTLGMKECESEVRAVAGKSVVAAIDIPADTCLTADMLTLKRPGTGIPAGDLQRVAGRRSSVDIPSDTTLSWDMLR